MGPLHWPGFAVSSVQVTPLPTQAAPFDATVQHSGGRQLSVMRRFRSAPLVAQPSASVPVSVAADDQPSSLTMSSSYSSSPTRRKKPFWPTRRVR